MTDVEAQIEELGRALRHHDRSQLAFQLVEIVRDRVYLRHGVEVRQGAVVLDVGANVGVAACFFAAVCGAGTVHSFEPVAPTFELLRENVAPYAACHAHPFGLSSRAGRFPITHYPRSAVMSGLYADPERDRAALRTAMLNLGLAPDEADRQLEGRYEAETLECELRTLSSVVREQRLERIDLLKVDVERAELDVLAGIESEHWPLIGQVTMEIHEDEHLERIRADLDERGFEVATEQEDALRGLPVYMLYARRR